jgi:hypothetical protein
MLDSRLIGRQIEKIMTTVDCDVLSLGREVSLFCRGTRSGFVCCGVILVMLGGHIRQATSPFVMTAATKAIFAPRST